MFLEHLEECWSHSEPELLAGPLDAGTHLGEVELLSDLLQSAVLQTQLGNLAGVPEGACKPGAGRLAWLLGV